ncbi:MAG: hypothetical protein WCY41_05095 [Candidatus Micrarchaeia archaeon]
MAKQSTLAFLLPILLVCAAILAAYYFLPQTGAGTPSGGAGAISLSIGGAPFVSGNTAALRAASTCGAFNVSLDGARFGVGSPSLSAQFVLEEGSHSFFAQGNGCNSTLAFTVAARECEGDGAAVCVKNGCPGTRQCSGGVFSECALQKKVCSPGEKVGCSLNGCSFGHITCNQCGTGFGKCLPDPEKENATCAGTPPQQ